VQSSDPRLFAKAVAAFQSARYNDAERDFKKVLRGEPKHFGALNLYAILLMQTGRVHDAEPLLRKAVSVDARSDASFYNFGLALKQNKKPAEALEAFTRSIALKPENAETWNNRGTVLNDLARYAEALEDFDKAIALNPAYAEAMSNRGRSLLILERYDESAAGYDHALKVNPNLPEAWMGRGTIQFRMKRWNEALTAFQTAVKLRGNFQEAWVAAGNTLLEMGRYNDAVRTFETALGCGRDNAAAWTGLANALHALGENEKAMEASNTAIQIDAESPETLIGRSNLLAKLGDDRKALTVLESFLKRQPNHVEGLVGRGNVLKNLKEYAEALASYDHALTLAPFAVEAKVGRGNVLSEIKRFTEALEEYDQVLKSNENLAEAWLGKGLVHAKQDEFDAADAAFHTALDLNPRFAEAWTGYGYMLNQAQKYGEAIAAYDRAIEIKPLLAEAWLGRGSVLSLLGQHLDAQTSLAEALRIKSDIDFVKGDLLHEKAWNCDWINRQVELRGLIADLDHSIPVVGTFQSLSLETSPAQQLACANLVQKQLFAESPPPFWRGERYVHPRIRIAYLSADFREHAVAYLCAGLLEQHDRSRFEITAISVGKDEKSPMRARVAATVDHFIDGYKISNQDIAHNLREKEIDILVDLGGHTAGSRLRLLAWRPCPVQATYLGYPGTTGLESVDYVIADPTVIPPDQQPFYSEKVAYLPDCYLPNDRTRAIGQAPDRAVAGLPASGFVFCSFNQPYKITPVIFDVWMRLLKQVPDSILWLPKFGTTACANLQREAEQRGVSKNRIIFADRTERQEDHLARLALADLFLDTPAYNAHSTACDALWAGLPLITCIGSTFAGRVGASALKAIGLPELVTTSLEDYEALALKLATDPGLLASIRTKLAAQRMTTPLFDTERFTRNLEALYLKMWQRAQAGEAPTSLSL
jgi:predicted O-linked N-acetylglucosamine transferase (SPINDLY family)